MFIYSHRGPARLKPLLFSSLLYFLNNRDFPFCFSIVIMYLDSAYVPAVLHYYNTSTSTPIGRIEPITMAEASRSNSDPVTAGNPGTPGTPDTNTQEGGQNPPFDPQAALQGMDPQQFQQLMVQAMANFSTGLGTLGTQLASLGNLKTPREPRDEKPPTYAVNKLRADASFQEREDWLQAVEQGNATRGDRPQWLLVQWASTWMESETQQRWRARQNQLHDGDFQKVLWQEFKDYVNSDYLGGDSGEIQAQRDWMACAQNDRSPQEFYREWATLVRRLPGMDIESTFMARDYWIKLDRLYHNRYAEAVTKIQSAKDCAEWCERIWIARASTRNGRERDAHRKRLGSPSDHDAVKKFARTSESTFSGPRHERARIVTRGIRGGRFSTTRGTPVFPRDHTPGMPSPSPPNPSHAAGQPPLGTASPLVCYGCNKTGHTRRDCPDERPISSPNSTPIQAARVQAIGSANQDEAVDYPEPSDSDSDSGNGGR